MGRTKRTRIVKQILASLSKCFFAMRIAFIFKIYSKFLQHQSYVFSLWDGGRLRSCHGEPIGRCHGTHIRPRATRKPRHCADEAHSAHRGFLGRAPQRNLLRDTEAPLRMLVDAAPHTRIKSIRFNRPKNKSIKSISGLRRRAFFGTT